MGARRRSSGEGVAVHNFNTASLLSPANYLALLRPLELIERALNWKNCAPRGPAALMASLFGAGGVADASLARRASGAHRARPEHALH